MFLLLLLLKKREYSFEEDRERETYFVRDILRQSQSVFVRVKIYLVLAFY